MAPPRRKLEPSKLAQQIEFLHDTIPLDELQLVSKGRVFKFSESIIGGNVHRTIEGASTLDLTVTDYNNAIRNSGMLGAEVDTKLDGLWFRLVKVGKSGNDLTLTFESREVAILRTYDKKRTVGWGKMSRTRFVEILMNESPQTRQIPFVCPELKKGKKSKTADEQVINRETGFGVRRATGSMGVRQSEGTTVGTNDTLTVKREPATPEQQRNIEIVLETGEGMISVVNKHRRKILVCSIMTGIQESTCRNLPYGDKPGWKGFFQQNALFGWPASGDVATDARAFFEKAIALDTREPNRSYNDLCQAVQNSGVPDAYGQWRSEAERWVTAYGIVGGDADDADAVASTNLMSDWEQDATEFQFTRGNPKTLPGGRKGWKNESTWDCMNRLAEEVNWRCFEVSGKVYFISEPQLFKSAPRARIDEQSPGVDWIDFDYDVGKDSSQVTITGRAGLWAAPPGTVVEVMNNGPVNGRWLVTDINRGIFDPDVSITCKKPRAKLPEPTQATDAGGLWDNVWTGQDAATYTPEYTRTPSQKGYPIGEKLRNAVLNHPNIEFAGANQSSDVQFNKVDERVLQFLLGFADAGFTALVSSLKTGHSIMTNDNNVSAHSVGKAVDIGNYSISTPKATREAMNWIKLYQVQFGWSQLIGPLDDLVVPVGYYGQSTLEDHDDHIHVGWAI